MSIVADHLTSKSTLDETLFEAIAQGIETQGYVILPAALPESVCTSLVDHLADIEQEEFHAASVGRGTAQTQNEFVRRNSIYWIEEDDAAAKSWLDWSSRLRLYLNRRLFLGLFSFESHFSIYQVGDFYRKHVDAFKGESNRVLSLVVYLNKGWEPDQGGELKIFLPAAENDEAAMAATAKLATAWQSNEPASIKVAPSYGTIVLFLSEEFSHEVLPTRRDRYAIAGWFRLNSSLNDNIDPPR